MPIHDLPTLENTKVRVIFKGFFLARIREAKDGFAGEAMIGAIDPVLSPPDDPPLVCHQPVIQVLGITRKGVVKTVWNVATDPDKDFFLKVVDAQGTEKPRIDRFEKDDPDFNRLDERENDKKDFRWFVDFDRLHELGEPVSVNENKLKPKFFLNKGVFHASDLSDGEVRLQRDPKNPSPPPSKRFGRFAIEITARVQLASGTKAIFRKGTDDPPIFTIESGTAGPEDVDRYEIVFDCQCRNRENDSDLDLIYTHRLVTNVNEPKQISLPADRPVLRFSPEVYCMGGGFGGG